MSKWEKLLQKILALSKELRFEELRKVLESYGYVMQAPRGGSSHYTFRKPGYTKITIPKHNPIKRVYVEMVKDVVENEVLDNEIH
jgi:predicted RNA binding protein YcfA (HicA-like mRNA interferase family)